jgi:hypothetical protein
VTSVSTSHKNLVTNGYSYKSGAYPAAPNYSAAKLKGNSIEEIMTSGKAKGIHGVYILDPMGRRIRKVAKAGSNQVQSKL